MKNLVQVEASSREKHNYGLTAKQWKIYYKLVSISNFNAKNVEDHRYIYKNSFKKAPLCDCQEYKLNMLIHVCFFFNFYLFIFIFDHARSSLLCTGFAQLHRAGVTLFVVCGLLLFLSTGSRAHGLQ